ncbi:glutaredoxin [Sistotremastrum niveocremeum HHB9708]|uniref:Glutaredoxin n=2 Tax=Sistotremastraceae TaxID=3402574 RepID=A0A164NWF8_9AGAM|nr:glutaredoxin [Sistotremastrum niveocremeum HHB9708]KZT40468.1 glutaredoxin [Sistotremastrum suecicum HHB10207 ss-3]
MSTNFHEVVDVPHFQALLSEDLNRVSLLNFWAPWAEPCKQMNEVVKELANKYEKVLVLQIEAESLADITESFEVEAVPTFVLLRGHTLLTRISGADAAALANALAIHAHAPPKALSQTNEKASVGTNGTYAPPVSETPEELNARLKKLMNQSKVMLFMKGTPDHPQCGFSRKSVAILRDHKVEFDSFNILTDESVRQGLKVLNNWPTFPQLIINGELAGGLDILKEMAESGELQEALA